MSILIVTPSYGRPTVPYVKSLINTLESFREAGVDHDILMTTNESLITRARNTSAREFLKTRFEKLMFIDDDIEFTPEDVAKLWNHNLPLVCAAYPWKVKGAPTSTWMGGRRVEISDLELETLCSVDYAGTGFMMIDRALLEALKPVVMDYDEQGQCWDFFGTFVTDAAEWQDRCFLSEDYAFCHWARHYGHEVMLDPSIRLKHHGTYAYDGS